jgi:hypothetical protein
MKRTLFASLVSGLSRIFRTPQPVETISDRPLEQIINEGSLGTIETPPKPKTRAELDREYLLSKFDPKRDIAVMSKTRFVNMVSDLEEVKDVDELFKSIPPNIIFLEDVVNIGIVKAH